MILWYCYRTHTSTLAHIHTHITNTVVHVSFSWNWIICISKRAISITPEDIWIKLKSLYLVALKHSRTLKRDRYFWGGTKAACVVVVLWYSNYACKGKRQVVRKPSYLCTLSFTQVLWTVQALVTCTADHRPLILRPGNMPPKLHLTGSTQRTDRIRSSSATSPTRLRVSRTVGAHRLGVLRSTTKTETVTSSPCRRSPRIRASRWLRRC